MAAIWSSVTRSGDDWTVDMMLPDVQDRRLAEIPCCRETEKYSKTSGKQVDCFTKTGSVWR